MKKGSIVGTGKSREFLEWLDQMAKSSAEYAFVGLFVIVTIAVLLVGERNGVWVIGAPADGAAVFVGGGAVVLAFLLCFMRRILAAWEEMIWYAVYRYRNPDIVGAHLVRALGYIRFTLKKPRTTYEDVARQVLIGLDDRALKKGTAEAASDALKLYYHYGSWGDTLTPDLS